MQLRVFEGFAGYGSQLLELKDLGIPHESVGTSEIDYNAIIAYAAVHDTWADIEGVNHEEMRDYLIARNIGYDFKKGKSLIPRMKKATLEQLYSATVGQKCLGDISLIDPENLPGMDLFTYSFPCQDISVAGNGKGFDEDSATRSSLLWECRKVVKGVHPPFLMMENVKNIIGKKHKANFDKWLEWLESQGYNNYYKVVNAKLQGVPQNRERVFLVSIKREVDDGTFEFMEEYDSGVRLLDLLEDEVDESYYMATDISAELIKRYVERYGEAPAPGPAAIRGRDVDNPTARVSGRPTVQNLETNESGTSNCVTTVAKDNVVVEVYPNELDMIGMLDMKGNESIRRIYDPHGIAPSVTTCQGGHREPKIIEVRPFLLETSEGIEVREATKQGYKLGRVGDSVNLEQPNSSTRRGRVAQTLTTSCNQGVIVKYDNGICVSYRIRKLTPRECLRLMGLSETEIDKIQNAGISNSQQYKLAGNSIVKQAMAFLAKLPLERLQSGIMGGN